MNERNRKIIDAVIKKADRVCPGSLALIGIYGSFATGDFHEKSDLDLLVLINDDNGWQLSRTFIQDDTGVGHDIYCTTWESLRNDALYNDPNISKLMDCKIVYCADDKYQKELETLRKQAGDILSAPFSREDHLKAENMVKQAEPFYLSAMIAESLSDARAQAGYAVYYIENAVAMLNKRYFRYGTKRVYEELEQMEKRPRGLCEMIENVLSAEQVRQLREDLTVLMRETVKVFRETEIPAEKKPVTAQAVGGTYEEMFSNWRNKMYIAAEQNNRHLAFMSLVNMNAMISGIGNETEIGSYDVLGCYDPNDLQKTAQAFDELLNEYLKEYERAGLCAERYKDIDDFVGHYTK